MLQTKVWPLDVYEGFVINYIRSQLKVHAWLLVRARLGYGSMLSVTTLSILGHEVDVTINIYSFSFTPSSLR
jgi:hypothetical protein